MRVRLYNNINVLPFSNNYAALPCAKNKMKYRKIKQLLFKQILYSTHVINLNYDDRVSHTRKKFKDSEQKGIGTRSITENRQ